MVGVPALAGCSPSRLKAVLQHSPPTQLRLMPTFTADQLTAFAAQLLAAGGLDAQEAALVGKSLVGANLRGHDSHGVMRIPYYLDELGKGTVKAGAEFTVIKETPTALVCDGHW